MIIFIFINDHIHFLKQQKIKLPECWSGHRKYNFGGYYLNNYISLENIIIFHLKILRMVVMKYYICIMIMSFLVKDKILLN